MSKKISDEDVERIAARVAELISPTHTEIHQHISAPFNPWPNWNWPNTMPGYIGPYITC